MSCTSDSGVKITLDHYPRTITPGDALHFAVQVEEPWTAKFASTVKGVGRREDAEVTIAATGPEVVTQPSGYTLEAQYRLEIELTDDRFGIAEQPQYGAGRWTVGSFAHPAGSYVATLVLELTDTGASGGVWGEHVLATSSFECVPTVFGAGQGQSTAGADCTVTAPEKGIQTTHGVLWEVIRRSIESRRFDRYADFVSNILCGDCFKNDDPCESKDCCKQVKKQLGVNRNYRYGSQAYRILKAATEVFLITEGCCIQSIIDPEVERDYGGSGDLTTDLAEYLSRSISGDSLPYIDRIIQLSWPNGVDQSQFSMYPLCADSIRDQLCFIELIWSFWQESGQLVRSMEALAQRFQNLPVKNGQGLRNLELSPLRPLNNMLWGYVRDAQNRLSVRQRAAEYVHEYGLNLASLRSGEPATVDKRAQFLDTFHMLLRHASVFYREDAHTFIQPDPYRIFNTLRNLHIVLAEGAHNSFGDLPTASRIEMMTQQWLLAQPPMRLMLQTREMVPYEEAWMGQVDALTNLMGWEQPSVSNFHRLAVYGEQLLLSIRYTDWVNMSMTPAAAQGWARFWRPEVQGYIEAYYAVTGVDLAASSDRSLRAVDVAQPASYLRERQVEI